MRDAFRGPTFRPQFENCQHGPHRYRIQLNVSASLKEKLDLARALVSHANPSGDLAVVIERALDVLIENVQKVRFGTTPRPRGISFAGTKRGKPEKRARRREHVPNTTLREIADRDGLRCTFIGETGKRCESRQLLQIHHDEPWARGGGSEVEDLRLLCASHNRLLAEKDFGAQHVTRRITQQRRRRAVSRATASPTTDE